MFFNQGTRQPEASQPEKVNGDMASVWEELDDVQLATVVGGTVAVDAATKALGVEYAFKARIGDDGIFWDTKGALGGLVEGSYVGAATPDGVGALLVLASHQP